uniref:Reverse transcriptase domain-containing protein n=1 Tax=Dendroctonus ponderosae TaxID=77166 RepID=A0AAR5QKP0_DENPD
MGIPLSPVVANLFMEKFEETALSTAPLKPTIWYRYVDDTFMLWRLGRESLDIFLDHLNKRHPDIQFTMEVEQNHQLAFLDVLVSREGNRLDHKVYRKATHTDRYLHTLSNHHPSQKQGIIKTLTDRARSICGPQHLTTELQHLEKAFLQNGYSQLNIKRAVGVGRGEKSKSTMKAFLLFVPWVTDRIGRLLRKHNIK